MKNTPERLKALDNMVLAVKFYNEHISDTGYQIERRVSPDNQYIDLRIRTPRDDEYAAYPEVYFEGDWYGTGMVCFGIATTGYGDHSLRQAQRVTTGLLAATNLVQNLYMVAEVAGFTIK